MTGEQWYDLMFQLGRQPSLTWDCKQHVTYADYLEAGEKAVGCGKPHASHAFFIIYVFMVLVVLVNLFIAVTLQGFDHI